MKKNWSVSVMYMAERVGIIKKPSFLPRREDVIKIKSEVSGKLEQFKVFSLTYDYPKRTIVMQVIPHPH